MSEQQIPGETRRIAVTVKQRDMGLVGLPPFDVVLPSPDGADDVVGEGVADPWHDAFTCHVYVPLDDPTVFPTQGYLRSDGVVVLGPSPFVPPPANAAQPEIYSVTPDHGPLNPGTPVVIRGAYFERVVSVTADNPETPVSNDLPLNQMVIVSDIEIRGTFGPNSFGIPLAGVPMNVVAGSNNRPEAVLVGGYTLDSVADEPA